MVFNKNTRFVSFQKCIISYVSVWYPTNPFLAVSLLSVTKTRLGHGDLLVKQQNACVAQLAYFGPGPDSDT